MRTAKYRFWCKERLEFVKIKEIGFEEDGSWWYLKCDDDEMPHYSPEELVIIEWTGLFDKNGREIYEGDIVHYFITEWIDGYPVEREEKRVVRYSYGCFWLVSQKGDELLFHVHNEDDELSVIGNIYENKELLEESE